jgi:hypothetical protein
VREQQEKEMKPEEMPDVRVIHQHFSPVAVAARLGRQYVCQPEALEEEEIVTVVVDVTQMTPMPPWLLALHGWQGGQTRPGYLIVVEISEDVTLSLLLQ